MTDIPCMTGMTCYSLTDMTGLLAVDAEPLVSLVDWLLGGHHHHVVVVVIVVDNHGVASDGFPVRHLSCN